MQLLGGPTTIDVRMSGFTDTNKHGVHVHEFGSIDDKCAAAGGHFDPHNSQLGALAHTDRFVTPNLRSVYICMKI